MGDERITDEQLHRYFDGELSPGEAAAVQRRVELEPELRAKLAGLGEVRELVRATLEDAAGDLPADDLWARIQGDLAQSEPKASRSKPALRAIDGGAPRTAEAPRADAAAPEERPRPAERQVAPLDPSRRRRIATVVIGALALAAAVLLLVIRPGEPREGGEPQPIAQVEEPTAPVEPPPVAEDETAQDAVARTEVLEVDFGENSGAIFSIEGEDGEHYAVVWLADVEPKPTAEQ